MATKPRSGLRFGLFFVVCFVLSAFVSLYSSRYSSDADEYRLIYDSISSNEILFYETGRAEALYYFWNWISSRIGFNFEGFLFVSTLLFLSLKINALRVISGGGRFRIILIYFLILFLLHECIQYKIAWAVSIALWACIFFSRGQWAVGFFLALIAAGFHVTSFLLPLSFFCSHILLANYQISKTKSLLIISGAIYLALFSAADILINFIDARYFDYFSENRLSIQNSSGLFYYYAIGLTLVVLWLSREVRNNAPYVIHVSNLLMLVSVVVLYLLHQYVSMASRLSDVLLVMMIPVVNYAIENNKKFYLLVGVYGFAFVIFMGRLIINWQILTTI